MAVQRLAKTPSGAWFQAQVILGSHCEEPGALSSPLIVVLAAQRHHHMTMLGLRIGGARDASVDFGCHSTSS